MINKNDSLKTDSDRKYAKILGINVVSTSKDKVLMRVKDLLSHNNKFYIVTPNPELVLMAQKNRELKEALNSSEIPVPDGVGLKLAIPGLKIIKGRELFLNIIDLASENKWKIFFLGGMSDEAELAAKKLKEKYRNLKIESFAGPILDVDAIPVTKMDRKLYFEAIRRINDFKPDLLFVAMENPRQEIFIYNNFSKLQIGGAMTVGGTFRYISGISKLPPFIFEKLGLEWLWRLTTEPMRIKRILNAVIVFPFVVLKNKLFGNRH